MSLYTYKARIERVIDGDSCVVSLDLGFGIELKNQKVRINGIDTPESWRPKDEIEKVFGNLAKDFVKETLKVGETYTCISYKDSKGKFGRLLLDFYIYDHAFDRRRLLTEVMIGRNLGVKYEGQSKTEIEEEHLRNRERLVEAGIVSISPDFR